LISSLLIIGGISLLFIYDFCRRFCIMSSTRSKLSDFFYFYGIFLSLIFLFIHAQYLSYSKNMMLGSLSIINLYEWIIWFVIRDKLKYNYDKFIDIISFIMVMFILPFLVLVILVGFVLGHPF
jgi:hypothetical protein